MRSFIRRLIPPSPLSACCSSIFTRAPVSTGLLVSTTTPASYIPRTYRMASTLPRLPVFEAIAEHDPESTVAVHSLSGRRFKYGELLGDVRRARDRLHEAAGKTDMDGERIAFLVENSYDYVVTLLAILAARSIAVPLSPAFPIPELQYILDHSEASLLLSSSKFTPKAEDLLAAQLASKPTYVKVTKHEGGGAHEKVELEGSDAGRAGMMLYTSGTTNRPKGVLIPERVMTAQARSLLKAWEYSPSDYLLHVLPLHHIHGTINAIYTPLFAGSGIEFMFPFNADAVWKRFAAPFLPESKAEANGDDANGAKEANGHAAPAAEKETNGHAAGVGNGSNGHAASGSNGHAATTENGQNGHTATTATTTTTTTTTPKKDIITFFTAVPTVYSRLLTTFKGLTPELQEAGRKAVSPANLRLNISGSAALPTPVKKAWADLTGGNVLLERFGMTEVGMALSCGLDNADRVDGSVGWPLPSVQARLVDVDTGEVIGPDQKLDGQGRERAGEIQLRGPTVFAEYWRNPAATASEFVPADESDADQTPWFKTGDVAVRRKVASAGAAASLRPSQDWTGHSGGDMFFILGRKSADIIKSGGEKVSALEVERELLSLPQVAEAAVVAVPSGKWGQKVGAAVVLDREHVPEGRTWTPLDMRRALKRRLVAYKIPQVMRVVDAIPRNAMGKINKKQLVREVFLDDFSGDEAAPAPAPAPEAGSEERSPKWKRV